MMAVMTLESRPKPTTMVKNNRPNPNRAAKVVVHFPSLGPDEPEDQACNQHRQRDLDRLQKGLAHEVPGPQAGDGDGKDAHDEKKCLKLPLHLLGEERQGQDQSDDGRQPAGYPSVIHDVSFMAA